MNPEPFEREAMPLSIIKSWKSINPMLSIACPDVLNIFKERIQHRNRLNDVLSVNSISKKRRFNPDQYQSQIRSFSALGSFTLRKRDESTEFTTFPTFPLLLASSIATQSIENSYSLHDGLYRYLNDRFDSLARKISNVTRYVNRIIAYMIYGTPLLIIAPATRALADYFPGLEEYAWDYFIWSVTKLGPTFIKLAQWASTRPDLFPPKLVTRLQSLQDNVAVPYEFDVVEKTLEEAFGSNWSETIELDRKPIGTGCVAQVYRGKLRIPPNDKSLKSPQNKINVAVKMIHPHVESTIHTDMELLAIFAKWIDSFPSLEVLSIGETLMEFGEMMKRQLDLRVEARNLKTFIKKFKNDSWALFPAPVEGYVRKNILVETLMEGSSIVNYMQMSTDDPSDTKTAKLKLKLSDLGARLIIKMIFFDNFVHGDLHPGNVLVQFDARGEPHLVVLDCGIVYAAKSEEEHKRIADICFAFMKRDGRTAGKLMIDQSKRSDKSRADEFCSAIQDMIIETENVRYFENLGNYIARICELARIYAVKLEPGYFAIAMALKVIEGVSVALNKDIDMVTKCVPIVLKTKAMRAVGLDHFPMPEPEEFEQELQQKKQLMKK